jgi:cellulose synthase/poly-beta-1,6-N-acetylglucosamine synthase-like glycosyltransferase
LREGWHVKDLPAVSIIVPTFNGATRIPICLDGLCLQTSALPTEILVIDDGSTDSTKGIVKQYASVRLVSQANAGPAAARNRGVLEARGEIVLFIDDDCVADPNWLKAMIEPFSDPDVVAAKGVYRSQQKQLIARFVQIEYEDRYRRMAKFSNIDFIDTYSAAFRREKFLEIGGFDVSFPVACAEDAELSYRMSARGWKMKFAPDAIVYHTHPDTLTKYLAKKYKFAYWRMLAVRKNPNKALADSHTPQLMKLQLLFPPALLLAVIFDLAMRLSVPATGVVLIAFLISTLPFTARAMRKDPVVGLLSPILLALRACAQLLGVTAGIAYAHRGSAQVQTKPVA